MKAVPSLAAIVILALSAPAWAQSFSASPRLTPYEGQRYDLSWGEGARETDQSRYRTEEFNSRLYEVPPITDRTDPMNTVPPPTSNRTKVQSRVQTQTRFENEQRAITERSRRGVAPPPLGIPGQQPWGVPSQPSRGVPGQQPRPAWQPKQ